MKAYTKEIRSDIAELWKNTRLLSQQFYTPIQDMKNPHDCVYFHRNYDTEWVSTFTYSPEFNATVLTILSNLLSQRQKHQRSEMTKIRTFLCHKRFSGLAFFFLMWFHFQVVLSCYNYIFSKFYYHLIKPFSLYLHKLKVLHEWPFHLTRPA